MGATKKEFKAAKADGGDMYILRKFLFSIGPPHDIDAYRL